MNKLKTDYPCNLILLCMYLFTNMFSIMQKNASKR